MMRVVKLDKRFVLAKQGYTHAFRFDCWNNEAYKIETVLRELHPSTPWINGAWCSHFSKRDNYTKQRPYWIGVKSESDITRILLMI